MAPKAKAKCGARRREPSPSMQSASSPWEAGRSSSPGARRRESSPSTQNASLPRGAGRSSSPRADLASKLQIEFRVLDAEKTGTIDRDDLRSLLLELDDSLTAAAADRLLKEADKGTRGGKIDYQGFINYIVYNENTLAKAEAEVDKALHDFFRAQTDKNGFLDVERFMVAQAALARVLGDESDRASDMAACMKLSTTPDQKTMRNKFSSWQRERLVCRGMSASKMAEVLCSTTAAITGQQHSNAVCARGQKMPQTLDQKFGRAGMQTPGKRKPCDAGLTDLLGPTLYSRSCPEGEVWRGFDTAEAIAGCGAVALYFSAHWCPPCRKFTPKLAKWYTADLKAKGLEVVFVSSDRDMSTFQSYYREMPWLALPFDDRSRREALSRRFKIEGIPTLVILGPDGKVITAKGVQVVSSDPAGDNFPWKRRSLQEVLSGAKLLGQKDSAELSGDSLENRCFGLYFSAHWCPPCNEFTPQLANWYTANLKSKGLEVVFVSSDRDEASFKQYFNEMPWLALDFGDRKRKEELTWMFGVTGIPALVIIGSDGQLITKEGCTAASSDPRGESLPWYPKAIVDLEAGFGSVPNVPTIIGFCEGSAAEVQQAAVNGMTPLAKSFLQKQKDEGEEDPRFAFMVATMAGGVAETVRELMSLPLDAWVPRLMLIDIPDGGGFYHGPEGPITADSVAKLVSDYESKTLKRQQLPPLPLAVCFALGIKVGPGGVI